MNEHDETRTAREIGWMVMIVVVICTFMICCTYSCTRPSEVDREQQAIRVEATRQMQACVATGGTWMPVRNGYSGDQRGVSSYYTSSMSCVTDKTLPLATKMNTGE